MPRAVGRPRLIGTGLAALLAALPPLSAQADLKARVDAALTRARPVLETLWAHQSQGQLALLCLAMVHDGMTMRDPALASAITRLRSTQLIRTYDLSLRLMVMADLRDYPERGKAAAADLAALLQNQAGDGGFGYTPPGRRNGNPHWDLSNTQYAALGMRAAASLGAKADKKQWIALANAVLKMQDYGGFSYRGSRRGSDKPTTSMTVAGIAVLEICKQQLGNRSGLRGKLGTAVNRGWGFMARHVREIGADQPSMRNYYFHYGLERAGILSDRTRVGNLDWYVAGAEMLLRHQHPDGAWHIAIPGRRSGKNQTPPPDPINTAFAVLFLRRQFKKTLQGPITPGRHLVRTLPLQATPNEIDATVAAEVARSWRAVPDLIMAMRSQVLARRMVAAKALPQITGRFHDYSPYRPDRSADVIREAERWWMTEGRKKADKG